MFGSLKFPKIRVAVILPLCLILLAAICLLLRTGAPDTVSVRGGELSLRVEDDSDIEAFFKACGIENAEQLSGREVTVPMHWNDTYTAYQELQRQQGFDLVPYKGKTARELCYYDGERYITVLVSGDRIIAAHICDSDGSNIRALVCP